MAYKAILAGDTGAASAKNAKDNTNKVKSALSSGRYSFYWESSVPIGTPSQAVDFKTGTTPWTFKECLDACDAEGECLAAGMTKVTKAATDAAQEAVEIGSCRLVKGVMTAGVGNRSVTKVDLERLSLPAAPGEHFCPSLRLLLPPALRVALVLCNAKLESMHDSDDDHDDGEAYMHYVMQALYHHTQHCAPDG